MGVGPSSIGESRSFWILDRASSRLQPRPFTFAITPCCDGTLMVRRPWASSLSGKDFVDNLAAQICGDFIAAVV